MVKVGDRIRILIDGANFAGVKKGDEFIVRRVYPNGSVSVEDDWLFTSDNYEISRAAPLKNPIEHLKAAHADGDLIDPTTMLRECFGIEKTERVVVEWSEVKREIKVGDKVRLLRGGGKVPLYGFQNGDIYTVEDIDVHGDFKLTGDNETPYGYAHPSSVELV